jgi:hypothetical protein
VTDIDLSEESEASERNELQKLMTPLLEVSGSALAFWTSQQSGVLSGLLKNRSASVEENDLSEERLGLSLGSN